MKLDYIITSILIILMVSIGYLYSCKSDTRSNLSSGNKLVDQYCGRCHKTVNAKMLNKDKWLNSVLPAMAPRLGIEVYQDNQYYPNPDGSKIPFEEWTKIVEYFKENAPEKLELNDTPNVSSEDFSLFSVRKPQLADSLRHIATTSLVEFNPFKKEIFTSDATYNSLYRWDNNLKSTLIEDLNLTAVAASFYRDSTGVKHQVFTSIGTMQAVDVADGKVIDINLSSDSITTIGSKLERPVQSLSADFNKDGLRDWIVCGFGHDKGGLFLFEQQPDYQFKKKAIRSVPGAIDAEIGDFNSDGWPDIMVLFAHGDEGIWMMVNDQEGGFKSENLLRFPPVYGSTSFQLQDMNSDGKPDIVYTAGDNADYSQILKPYHGIYIFINKDNYRFKKEYFFHLNGATEATAADFDGDGDIDIAANAFFADLKNNPSESFVYLDQQGTLNFTPKTPKIHTLGRWLTMDVYDFERDGDPDIVLGNYSRQFVHQEDLTKDWNTQLPFILLSNNTK